MGKRKSAKPQKYIQPSSEDEEDEDSLDENMHNERPNHAASRFKRSTLWQKPLETKEENVPKEPLPTLNGDKLSTFNGDKFSILNGNKFDFKLELEEPLCSSPLEALLSEKIMSSGPFLSHTRSGKRRRKYVTYPASFRLAVVEAAEQLGKSAAAKKFNICVEKVSMWCKTKDNIVHKVKKGGHGSTEDGFEVGPEDVMEDFSGREEEEDDDERPLLYDSDASDSGPIERCSSVVFPVHFKHRVVCYAAEKGEEEAASEFKVLRARVATWCQAKEYLVEYATTNKVEEWEVDLYVWVRRVLEAGRRVAVRDLIVRAEQAQLASPAHPNVTTAWLADWCACFRVRFQPTDGIYCTPQALTESTCLALETSFGMEDKEEKQLINLRSKVSKVCELIEDSRQTPEGSPSTSDHEDSASSLSLGSKRRRRSYTLAFKLEVVKFAQSHTKHATSRKYGIARRVISRWIADREVLQQDLDREVLQQDLDKGFLVRDAPLSEEEILPLLTQLKRKGDRITKETLLSEARILFGDRPGLTDSWVEDLITRWKVDMEPSSSSSSSPSTKTVSSGGSLAALQQALHFPGLLSALQQSTQQVKENVTNEKKPSSTNNVKKRRERYSPDFKMLVIEYAATHSYQETSRKFGVHHITVSEWCKDKERIRKKVYCENLQNLQTKILKSETAEQKFLSWIQECNKHKVCIRPADVQTKASEILRLVGEAEVKKQCWWFYLWNKRSSEDGEELERDSRVNYPPAVKVEIAKVAERQSVNCAAKCFRVARKRIREWVKSKEKLRWLAETGQVRERGSAQGRSNCLEVDKEVYNWYSSCEKPPSAEEIRARALEVFRSHGFSHMKCSREWFRNWCRRYRVCRSPAHDHALIRWVLMRYDQNLPATHTELLHYCSAKERDKAEYVRRFCRRYPRLLESLPSVGEPLPPDLEAEVGSFRSTLCRDAPMGALDQVPLAFTRDRVITNSGMPHWDAVVVLACLSDGHFLPPFIVLKGREGGDTVPAPHVLFREGLLVDDEVMRQWAADIWLRNVPSPSMLLVDCFEPHTSPAFQEWLQAHGAVVSMVPAGCGSRLLPLRAGVARAFCELLQESWAKHQATSSFHTQIVGCIVGAFEQLRTRHDLVRRSFAVTGVGPDADPKLIDNTEWFGCEDDPHALSPADSSDDDA